MTGVQRPALAPLNVIEDRTPVRRLEFVEVRAAPMPTRPQRPAAGVDHETPIAVSLAEPGWTLWSDAET